MPYPTTVDTGQVQPWIISNDAATLVGVNTTTLVANAVYLYAFETAATITVTGGKWRMGNTGAGTTDIGVYDNQGNLLGHTGAFQNVANTNMTASMLASIDLAPGQYFMAFCPSSASDNYLAVGGTSSQAAPTRNRVAALAATGGLLPSFLTGGYTDAPTKVPSASLTIAGGLT